MACYFIIFNILTRTGKVAGTFTYNTFACIFNTIIVCSESVGVI